MIAYKITDLTNGKIYVGITRRKSLDTRWREHVNKALYSRHRLSAIHYAIRKRGVQNFQIEQIASAKSWVDLCAVECLLIAQYATLSPGGYNLTTGGDGPVGLTHDLAARQKMSASQRKRFSDPAELARLIAINTGRSPGIETRAKMSAARAGKPRPQHVIAAMQAGRAAMTLTDETRAKMSASHKGQTPWIVGKRHSEETRAKMSAAAKARPSNRLGVKLTPEQCAAVKAKRDATKLRKQQNGEAIWT